MNIEYVIYCRKSTDESSWNQVQSIPDQISKCVEYAKNNWIKIKEKPDDFSKFENELEIIKEENEPDFENKKIYKNTRNLFIVKEQCTAKIPGARKKRRELMKLVSQWRIKWILSYAPDRQSRNMLEWWELIDYVDQWLLDLKYTNFHFENTASWKMMLWIWFVFSKQYSDKLSDDITRWNESKRKRWKALWKFKYWYFINEDWYYEPHPEYFDLMRRAFEMKIYEDKSDSDIANYLNANWFKREFKTWDRPVDWKRLWDVWRNEFYYWMDIWDTWYYNLIETNPYFKPLISEEEFNLLQEKLNSTNKRKAWKIKDKTKDYYPFENWFLKATDGSAFSCTLPNPWRFNEKLKEIQKIKPKANLWDVVKPNNIHFRVTNSKSKFHNKTITFDIIEKAIIKKLQTMKVSEKEYNEYIEFAKTQADSINKIKRTEANKLQVKINSLTRTRKDYIKKYMWKNLNKEEQEIYKNELDKYENEIDYLEKQKSEINISERNEILELTVFLDMLRKADEYFKKASYVQKRKICKILFSNIIFYNKKRLTIKVNPAFESLFSWNLEMMGIEPMSESW